MPFTHVIAASGGASDRQPNAFSFTSCSSLDPATSYVSNTVTPTGYNTSAPISVAGCCAGYSLNGGAYTSSAGTICPNQTLTLCGKTPPDIYSTACCITATIGCTGQTTVSNWSLTSRAFDCTPTAFSLGAATNETPGGTYTTSFVPTGYDCAAAYATGAGLCKTGSAWTAGPLCLCAGQTLNICVPRSAAYGGCVSYTVCVGPTTASSYVSNCTPPAPTALMMYSGVPVTAPGGSYSSAYQYKFWVIADGSTSGLCYACCCMPTGPLGWGIGNDSYWWMAKQGTMTDAMLWFKPQESCGYPSFGDCTVYHRGASDGATWTCKIYCQADFTPGLAQVACNVNQFMNRFCFSQILPSAATSAFNFGNCCNEFYYSSLDGTGAITCSTFCFPPIPVGGPYAGNHMTYFSDACRFWVINSMSNTCRCTACFCLAVHTSTNGSTWNHTCLPYIKIIPSTCVSCGTFCYMFLNFSRPWEGASINCKVFLKGAAQGGNNLNFINTASSTCSDVLFICTDGTTVNYQLGVPILSSPCLMDFCSTYMRLRSFGTGAISGKDSNMPDCATTQGYPGGRGRLAFCWDQTPGCICPCLCWKWFSHTCMCNWDGESNGYYASYSPRCCGLTIYPVCNQAADPANSSNTQGTTYTCGIYSACTRVCFAACTVGASYKSAMTGGGCFCCYGQQFIAY